MAELVLYAVLHKAHVASAGDLALVDLHVVQQAHLRLYHVDLAPKRLGVVPHQLLLLDEELLVHLGQHCLTELRLVAVGDDCDHVFPLLRHLEELLLGLWLRLSSLHEVDAVVGLEVGLIVVVGIVVAVVVEVGVGVSEVVVLSVVGLTVRLIAVVHRHLTVVADAGVICRLVHHSAVVVDVGLLIRSHRVGVAVVSEQLLVVRHVSVVWYVVGSRGRLDLHWFLLLPYDSALSVLTLIAVKHAWNLLFIPIAYLVVILYFLFAADIADVSLAVHHLRSDHVVGLADIVHHYVFGH